MLKNKVLVAMSGGVDSAAAALILKQQGYEISGITMRLLGNTDELDDNSVQAAQIAQKLQFTHSSVSLSSCFYENVILPFISEYKNGKTPNPCVTCHHKIKFGKLFDVNDKGQIVIKTDASGNSILKSMLGGSGNY